MSSVNLKLSGQMYNVSKFNSDSQHFVTPVVAPVELEYLKAIFETIGATVTFNTATDTFTIDYSTITSFTGLQALLSTINCTATLVGNTITVTNNAQSEAVSRMALFASETGAKDSIIYATTSPLQAEYISKYNDPELTKDVMTSQPGWFGWSDGYEYPNLFNYGFEIADPADNCSVYRIFQRDMYFVPINRTFETVEGVEYFYAMDVFGTIHKFKNRFQ